MKHTIYFRFAQVALLALMLSLNAYAVLAQNTTFSYQGSLRDGASPANGPYDLQFKLFDALNGGTQIGGTNTLQDVSVNNGVFSVALDFGAVFPGANRFLEIGVRVGTSTGAFTLLSPRQPITSTPYAIKSLGAAAADGLSAACVNCVTSSQINNINSSQITGAIASSQITVPLSLSGNSASPVLTTNNSAGNGVQGTSTNPSWVGVVGVHSSSTGDAPGIEGVSNSISADAAGVRGFITSINPGPLSAGVRGINNGTGATGAGVRGSHAGFGYGVYGTSVGGMGVYGVATSTTFQNYGVWGESNSSLGSGVLGNATATTGTNVGVLGTTASPSGIGVYAQGSGPTGTALQIAYGAIRVLGAGLGTSTTVFIHQATVANINSNTTVINHPMTNGNPNVILIVTPNWNPGGAVNGIYNNHPIGVYYTGTGWAIFNQDLAAIPVNAAFNVLIVKP